MNAMSKRAGVWIDHARAEIVILRDRKATTRTIRADVAGHRKSTGRQGVPLPGHAGGGAGSGEERHRAHQLQRYYEQVARALEEAGEILILGPGEAPGELKKHLESRSKRHSAISVRPSDKLTDEQLVAEVKDFFAE
jgi:hypothetical protein